MKFPTDEVIERLSFVRTRIREFKIHGSGYDMDILALIEEQNSILLDYFYYKTRSYMEGHKKDDTVSDKIDSHSTER